MNNLTRLAFTSAIVLLTTIVFAAEPTSPPRTGDILAVQIQQRVDPNHPADASMIAQDGYIGLERYCHHLAARRIEVAWKSTPQQEP